jgi:hypothetical protein
MYVYDEKTDNDPVLRHPQSNNLISREEFHYTLKDPGVYNRAIFKNSPKIISDSIQNFLKDKDIKPEICEIDCPDCPWCPTCPEHPVCVTRKCWVVELIIGFLGIILTIYMSTRSRLFVKKAE